MKAKLNPMSRKVEVVPYHPDWPEKFAAEANELQRVFGNEMLSIHHFGSTSIPGISAKPIIDILLIARDIQAVDQLTPQIEALGYHAVGEYGIPGRRFFYKGTHDARSHHLHVYETGNPHILRHLVFRDYMRTHPIPARDYTRLKEELARQFPEDMDGYIAGKNAFVKEHELKALEWWQEKGE
jgi:GrpB-like predicted nucleotidyltransferase (UPF0157 family)